MLSFFLRNFNVAEQSYSIKKYTKFDYIKRRYLDEVFKIVDYYQNKDNAVDNRHPLSKIITNTAPNVENEITDYLKVVETNVPYISKQFNITSDKSAGTVFHNVFYKDYSTEIMLLVKNDIDIFNLENTWRDAKPLRCIYTENTDLDFHIPNGRKSLPYEQISVFEIDLTLMMLQYKYWALERMSMDKSTNTNVFIATIVLPNSIGNILDLTLFNRYIKIAQGEKIKEFDFDHPFNVLDLSRGVDKIYKDVAKDTVDSSLYLEQLIETIPCVYNTDMNVAVTINKSIYNKQSEWVLWVARISYIRNLIEIMGKRGLRKNKDEVNSLPSKIKLLERRETNVDTQLDIEFMNNFYQDIRLIKKEVGSR